MTSEQWIPVPGFEGFYEASNTGSVRSVDRTLVNTSGVTQRRRGVLLHPNIDKYGYPYVNLCRGGTRNHRTIGVIVAASFLGPRPDGLLVCHNDDTPTNNHVSNLRYDTPKGNTKDSVQRGRHRSVRKTECKRGHVLAEPNLSASKPARDCLSCARALSYCRYHKNMDIFDETANRYYAELMGTVTRRPKSHCKNGHEFTAETEHIVIRPTRTYRRCLICYRANVKRRNDRRGRP